MHYNAKRGLAIACRLSIRPSVSLSVRLVDQDHIGWKSWKLITTCHALHRVSKKLCQVVFCALSVKYKAISIKIGMIVPEQTLNETVPKLPISPKVCACTILGNLKCQIEPSTQLLSVYLND